MAETTDLIANRTVFMISDLHVGDPEETNLEDFSKDADFDRLLSDVIPGRCADPASLVIAGDFIDFPQVLPQLGRHKMGDRFGSTEEESVEKIERVIKGHPRVFNALRGFIERGNQVIVLPGNHDIDLHWSSVFEKLRAALGGPDQTLLRFVRGGEIHERRVHIEHGNQYSFDNWFEHWVEPIIRAPDGQRLERPWGTLFMDIVYNDIEKQYPFINKVYPHSTYAQIILRSMRDTENVSAKALGRLLLFFVLKGKRFIWEHLLGGEEDVTPEQITSPEAIQALLENIGADGPPERVYEVATETSNMASSIEASDLSSAELDQDVPDAVDLGLLGRSDRRGMEKRQNDMLKSGEVDLVAFGHTHEAVDGNAAPMWGSADPRRAFNTGSWMPAILVGKFERPRWRELRSRAQAHDVRYLVIELGDRPKGYLERL